ncbi:MAG: hypothetical protein NZM10_02375, partial [Fimbriimonadales bacterium]|nr:hypothetical protein [Fimbriimonadales bacterium]
PEFMPLDATHWTFWLALFALPLGWLAEIGAAYRWVWAWGALLGALWLFVLPFYPMVANAGGDSLSVAHIVGFALATWLLMMLTASLGDEAGAATPFLIATLGGISAGFLFYGAKSAQLAQMSGTLGAVVGAGVVLGWLLRGFRLGRGTVAVGMFLFMVLWTLSYGIAYLSFGQLVLLYLLAWTPALRLLPALQRRSPALRFALPLAILIVVGGAAVGLLYNAYIGQGDSYYGY